MSLHRISGPQVSTTNQHSSFRERSSSPKAPDTFPTNMASISAQNGVIHHGSKNLPEVHQANNPEPTAPPVTPSGIGSTVSRTRNPQTTHAKVTHLVSEEKDHDKDNDPLPADAAKGLMSSRAILFLILWYIFSLLTLFLNRIILTSLGGDPVVLSTFQMVGTTALGLAQMYYPCGMFKNVKREGARPKNFYRNMIIVGTCRFFTVFLGLLALEYVEVSFTETVKSSAPIFTVLIAKVLTGEVTGLFTQLSLIPIMSGLALCSAFELSFNFSGFIAALGTNLTECLQNVYSKMLICGTSRYTPAEMQYYTSVASILIQIPFCIFFLDYTKVVNNFSTQLLVAYLANGIFFHYQTICAYVLMGYISPVTHSVANTVKRALLIWLSILFFGNTVTFLSGFGTMIVFIGVLLYNKARDVDHKRLTLAIMYSDAKVNNV